MVRSLLFTFCALVSSASLAATYDLGPSDYRKYGPGASHTPSGLRSTFGQGVNIGSGSLTVSRNPVIPYNSIGQGLRNFTRINPGSIAASAAITGLFLAVDWVFDSASGQWTKIEMECPVDRICAIDGQFDVSSMCGNNPSAINTVGGVKTVTAASRFNMGGQFYPAGTVVTLVVDYSPLGGPSFISNCSWRYPSGKWPLQGTNAPQLHGSIVSLPGVLEPTNLPLTDSDFNELAGQLPSFPAGTVGDAARDVQRQIGAPLPGYTDTNITGPESVTGPSTSTTTSGPDGTIVTSSTETTNISYGPTTITTTNTTVTNTYTNGEHTGTETVTETPSPDLVTEPPPSSGSTSLDIPTDCDFMPTVCAFIDWFKEPVPMPEPDLPVVVDHDFEREYEMNLTAECPPPYTVDTQLFGTLSISWQPFCDLASLIKPLVVGSAFLLSAFITLGIGRGKA